MADDDSAPLGPPSGSLVEIERLVIALAAAIAAADEEFRAGSLDMDAYARISSRLKLIVDDFFSNFP